MTPPLPPQPRPWPSLPLLLAALLLAGSPTVAAQGSAASSSPAAAAPAALTPAAPAPTAPAPAEAAPTQTDDDPWAGDEWNWDWPAETADSATEPDVASSTEAAPEPGSTAAEYSSLELVRQGEDGKQRRIQVVRRGTADESGIFSICTPQEGEPENAPSVAVFSETGAGGVEITIDKNVIRVPLALVTQRQKADGSAGDGNIEAGGGSARTLDEVPAGATDRLARCGIAVQREPRPGSVKVTQGQTNLTGQQLQYDEADGIARISGPITFERLADSGSTGNLSGSAEQIEVDVDAERTVLVGSVVLNSSGGRVSRAARVEYDDAANLARLIGTPEQPAETVRGGERLQAAEILYDLERDEAVAWAAEGLRITGEFTDAGE